MKEVEIARYRNGEISFCRETEAHSCRVVLGARCIRVDTGSSLFSHIPVVIFNGFEPHSLENTLVHTRMKRGSPQSCAKIASPLQAVPLSNESICLLPGSKVYVYYRAKLQCWYHAVNTYVL